jgi:hypothetical protein
VRGAGGRCGQRQRRICDPFVATQAERFACRDDVLCLEQQPVHLG